ncbi:MAG: glycosyltransferase, partial [Candidatus Thermoplasmatota archaeon]
MRPDVSVVIPCLNERATLDACLDALEGQEFPWGRAEVIIVDGGSSDGSRQIAQARGVKLLSDCARGPSRARNIGIQAARADIVAFTDADCAPSPDWLARLRDVFSEDTD